MTGNLLETKNGLLQRAEIAGTNGELDESNITLEAITLGVDGPIVAVHVSAETAVELHDIPRLIHALKCALVPYGVDHTNGSQA